MNHISWSQFKAKAPTGELLIITDHGQPKLEIRPYKRPTRDVLAELRGMLGQSGH